MELLAPAGGEEQLEYAIRFGADAVYLAAQQFGMRARAANFPLEDLPRIVAKAHAHGVKVHLTCNIMMHEPEMAQLPAFLKAVDAAGVDAVIVGDLGACVLARKHAPRCQIHVSTQASICNAEAAKVWYDLGARRIVAAREMSLEALASLKKQLPQDMELEVFAHGAMCMAYSGRCLISDFMTGNRSGITGNCAQSCRWKYTLEEEKRPGIHYPVEEDGQATYIMNADDLCMLEHLDALAAAGVDSVKIEGRNKKAYYVACVVNAYRQVLDGADPANFMQELDSVSHRPYSTGFYFGPAHQTSENLIYVRKTEWAAQALDCDLNQVASQLSLDNGEEAEGPLAASAVDPNIIHDAEGAAWYLSEIKCRNIFNLDDEFEVLSPHKPVRPIRFGGLWHLPDSRFLVHPSKASEGWVPGQEPPEKTSEANHSGEHYYALTDVRLEPGDIVRVIR